MNCRHCAVPLELLLVDLGSAPPSNAYLTAETLRAPEKWFPLRVLVCENCWLAQTDDFADAEDLFGVDYPYFSGFSRRWLEHVERYVGDMIERFHLGSTSLVVEIATNDGSLLAYVKERNIPCLGVEPTASTAAAARAKGIPIIQDFFGTRLATELVHRGPRADLITANNVLAHVPDINDFLSGFAILLQPDGVATFEFPHLLRLIAENQFDTIYHEHFSYLSLTSVHRIAGSAGLAVFDVQELGTHGGSLRVFVQRANSARNSTTARVPEMLEREKQAGMQTRGYYGSFQERANRVKDDFVEFLVASKRDGRRMGAYGAAAKGNTLMNYAGIRPDLIPFVVDKNPAKQGKFMPGSRIPIVDESVLRETKPDYVVILPWNLRQEIAEQLRYIRAWDGQFVIAVPELVVAA